MRRVLIRHRLDIVEAWTVTSAARSPEVGERTRVMAAGEEDRASLLAFIEAQGKRLKKTDLEELSPLKLNRAAAAMADVTDEPAPDSGSAVFLTAWKRTDQCHHFWGPTVGQERFCTKCQVPRSALAPDEDAGPTHRRS
ncbi:MAG TPA: hypothetical protein VN791_02040 [Acidimicrobiales bacterium]|nr:hypothetical protein [Acidimicrobiales bacterium]